MYGMVIEGTIEKPKTIELYESSGVCVGIAVNPRITKTHDGERYMVDAVTSLDLDIILG